MKNGRTGGRKKGGGKPLQAANGNQMEKNDGAQQDQVISLLSSGKLLPYTTSIRRGDARSLLLLHCSAEGEVYQKKAVSPLLFNTTIM